MLDSSAIKSILKARVDEHKQAVGIVVGTVDGEATNVIGHGFLSKKQTVPVGGDTIFEIGSITKVFTALLLVDSAARGELNLDDPISGYLPDHVSAPVKVDRPITLKHLATHTSGLPRLPDNLDPADMSDPYVDYRAEDLYRFLNDYTPEREPDEAFEYSNLGAGLLGHLLELATGKSYEALIRERVCKPLGMNQSYLEVPDELLPTKAQGHSEKLAPVSDWHLSVLAGAGGLRSSVNDLAKFLRFNLTLAPSPLYTAAEKTHQAYANMPAENVAMGWHIRRRGGDAPPLLWHNGGTGGFRSLLALNKAARQGVVVLSNAENPVDDIGFHILEPSYPLSRFDFKEITLETSTLEAYIGDYKISPDLTLSISIEDGGLVSQASGQGKFKLFPETSSFFFVKAFDAQLTFKRDRAGTVSGLTVHQNGKDTFAPKVQTS